MGVSASYEIVLGYRIPFKHLVKEIVTEKPNCPHDKLGYDYCPQCGEPNQTNKSYHWESQLKGVDDDNIWKFFDENQDVLHRAYSNVDLEGGDEDAIVGVSLKEVDEVYDAGIQEIDLISKMEVDDKIREFIDKYKLHPDKSTFNLYLIQSCG